LDACITFNWSQELHAQLVEMAVNLLYISGPAATWDVGGSSKLRQEEEQLLQAQGQPAAHQQVPVGVDNASKVAELHCRLNRDRQSPDGNCFSSKAHALEDDLLPHRLHGGPMDRQQLAALGGPQKLLQHFCHAASTEAQRTLMVPLLQVKHNYSRLQALSDYLRLYLECYCWLFLPLPVPVLLLIQPCYMLCLQVLMPHDVADAAQLAILQVLCSSPNCLAALQTALSAGVPGWADPVLAAITQQLTHHELDMQLLTAVLLKLEDLGCARALGDGFPASSCGNRSAAGNLPEEVEVAMQVTLLHLAGQLPSLPQVRPGLQGTEAVVYQVSLACSCGRNCLLLLIWLLLQFLNATKNRLHGS
jgi:hypothetical protein